jgi:lysophospholipase
LIKQILLIPLFFLSYNSAFSVEESKLPGAFYEKVMPYIERHLKIDYFENEQGHKVRWAFISPKKSSKGTILLMHGRTEDIEKYREVIYDLHLSNYNVLTLDWVGQGGSDHISKKSPEYGHISDFNIYKRDVKKLLELAEVEAFVGSKPLFLLAHSMGANVASLFLSSYPGVVKKAALVSPMLDLITDPFPEKVAFYLLKVIEAIGMGENKALMNGEFSPNEKNIVTGSQVRRNITFPERAKNKKNLVGPPTNSYGRAAIEATWTMREDAEKIAIPVMMFQAGVDNIVETDGQDYVCHRMQDCTKIFYEKGKHELMFELDYIRDDLFKRMDEFFTKD